MKPQKRLNQLLCAALVFLAGAGTPTHCRAGLFDKLNNAVNTANAIMGDTAIVKDLVKTNSPSQEASTQQPSQSEPTAQPPLSQSQVANQNTSPIGATGDVKKWGDSPKDFYEMIGNPQVDLREQGSAYEKLKSASAWEPYDGNFSKYIIANYYLAECYVSGKTGEGGPDFARNQKGFPPNRPEAYDIAIPLYENAARHDHIPSLSKLSEIYADEKYAQKDPNKSITYLVKGVRLGDQSALTKLLALSSAGYPEIMDGSQKLAAIKLLADKGDPKAQFELAQSLLLENSEEATAKAKGLLTSLSASGNTSASVLLNEIESKENAARVQAEKVAAEQAQQKAAIEKQKAAEAQAAAEAEALQNRKAAEQKAEAQRAKERKSEIQSAIAGMIALLVITSIVLTFVGVSWGLKEKAIVFRGKSDLILSAVTSISLVILFCVGAYGYDDLAFYCLMGTLVFLLLSISIVISYSANQKSFGKAVVVVPTKLLLAGLLVFFGLALIGGTQQAIESTAKASKIVGNSVEERKERSRHKNEAIKGLQVLAFAAAIVYPLYRLVKKLVK